MTALEVIAEIIKSNPEISSVCFMVFIPFRDSEKVFPGRIFRYTPPKRIVEIKRKDATVKNLNRLADTIIGESRLLGFIAKVKLQNTRRSFYLPLMDFKCNVTAKNLESIGKFLTEVGQRKGVILTSGRSFHYYGSKPLSTKEWLIFLTRCFLFGYADHRYIVYQSIVFRLTILRVSTSFRHPKIPTAVSIL